MINVSSAGWCSFGNPLQAQFPCCYIAGKSWHLPVTTEMVCFWSFLVWFRRLLSFPHNSSQFLKTENKKQELRFATTSSSLNIYEKKCMQSALNGAEKSETERSSETATKSSHIYILNTRKSRFARFTRAFLLLPFSSYSRRKMTFVTNVTVANLTVFDGNKEK